MLHMKQKYNIAMQIYFKKTAPFTIPSSIITHWINTVDLTDNSITPSESNRRCANCGNNKFYESAP